MGVMPVGQRPHNEESRSNALSNTREVLNYYGSRRVSATSDPNRIWTVQQNTGLAAHLFSNGELRTILRPSTMTSWRFLDLLHRGLLMRELRLSQLFGF
jgi:hypothetical protein